MVYIYTLKLQGGKYYVGKTTNPHFRIESHFNANGSVWTKKYSPIKLIEIKKNCDDYDEDKVTRQYMDKYGIDNVRGGSFVSLKLERSAVETLTQMSHGTNDRCFKCGKSGHFARQCREDECWECENCGEEFTTKKKCEKHEKSCYVDDEDNEDTEDGCCFRCGRDGHSASSCYASKHVDGFRLKKINVVRSKATNMYGSAKLVDDLFEDGCCVRCGRDGHYASSCYASTHVDGFRLKKMNVGRSKATNMYGSAKLVDDFFEDDCC